MYMCIYIYICTCAHIYVDVSMSRLLCQSLLCPAPADRTMKFFEALLSGVFRHTTYIHFEPDPGKTHL